jgi:hypothetical protein
MRLTKLELMGICHDARESFCKVEGFTWDEDLASFCYDASDFLLNALLSTGIKGKLIEGECYGCFHYWVEVDNFICDLTIKQFERFAGKELPYYLVEDKSNCSMYEKSPRPIKHYASI